MTARSGEHAVLDLFAGHGFGVALRRLPEDVAAAVWAGVSA